MTYAVCIIWNIAFALWSAADDAEKIALNERIHHVRQWFIRAALVVLVCLCAGLPLFAVPMGALFSSVFRFTLNRLRGLDWRYVSPSSWYDTMFIYPFQWTDWIGIDAERAIHGALYSDADDPTYRRDIHRAGLLAYIAEAVVIALYVLLV